MDDCHKYDDEQKKPETKSIWFHWNKSSVLEKLIYS